VENTLLIKLIVAGNIIYLLCVNFCIIVQQN